VSEPKVKGRLAKEYVSKFENQTTAAIARALHKDFPFDFKDFDTARNAVRYYRGAKGKKDRKKRNLKKNITPKFNLPESCNEGLLLNTFISRV
jgi:hypothetical protein